jgi:GDP-mannose pyrophosphatase NudK
LSCENEALTVLEMTFEDALIMIEKQEIIDAGTIILLYHLKRHE